MTPNTQNNTEDSLQKQTQIATLQLIGKMHFLEYMLRNLFEDRLLSCVDPVSEFSTIKERTMSSLRLMTNVAESDSEACMILQSGAIEAGEAFFNLSENNIMTVIGEEANAAKG